MAGKWLEQLVIYSCVGDYLECIYVHSRENRRFTSRFCYKVVKVGGALGVYDDTDTFRQISLSNFVVRDSEKSVEVPPQKKYPNFYKEKDSLVYYKTIRDHLDYVIMTKKIFVIIGGDDFTPESDEVFEEIMERLVNDPSIKQNVDIE